MVGSETHCAIIADIIGSRKMSAQDRKQAQEVLISKISEYNVNYDSKLAAYFDFCAGDQIQALFYRCEDAYRFAFSFREEMYPVSFRIGIGAGDWTIRYAKESSNRQDGSAYHNARYAIDHLDKMTNRKMLFYSNNEIDAVINTLIANEERIFEEQTENQRILARIISRRHMIEPASITKEHCFTIVNVVKGCVSNLADELDTSPQNISQNIRRGKINDQKELQSAIIWLLNQHF